MAELSGKVAIVTGASTLIGAKITQGLAEAGAKVVMADIAEDDGARIAGELGADVVFQATDVTSDADIDACIAKAVSDFGGLDILVNVAATYLDNGPDTNREDFAAGLNVNVLGGFIFAQKARAQMLKRGGGAVINTASISGKIAQPGRMVYAVSKAGILHMTHCLAAAWASDNIRVNSVSPGWTWSNVMSMLAGGNKAQASKVAGMTHPMGRIGEPEEVANTVVFLASSKASFINGADVPVDGGYSTIGPERMDDMIPLLQEG
ncbi:MAG: glucose 1-dehydrogenase [Pseudomonadota bacterium]